MSVKTGNYLNKKNIYINYDLEQVMFRRQADSGVIHKKFYNEEESENSVPYDNRLYNDALLYGDEITEEEYLEGKLDNNEQS